MKNYLTAIFNLINYASIDVALGAVCCMLPLLVIYQIPDKALLSIMLFSAVVVIYWFDHYFDTLKKSYKIYSNRHVFVITHFKKLVVISALLIIINLYFLWLIYSAVYLPAIVIGGILIVIYFLHELVKPLKYIFSKEVLVSMVYSTVVCLPAICFNLQNLSNLTGVILATPFILFLSVMQNMFMVNITEFKLDQKNASNNIVLVLGLNKTKNVMQLMLLVQAVMVIALKNKADLPLTVYFTTLLIVSLLQHLLLNYDKTIFIQMEWYRKIGELSFLLPMIGLYAFNYL